MRTQRPVLSSKEATVVSTGPRYHTVPLHTQNPSPPTPRQRSVWTKPVFLSLKNPRFRVDCPGNRASRVEADYLPCPSLSSNSRVEAFSRDTSKRQPRTSSLALWYRRRVPRTEVLERCRARVRPLRRQSTGVSSVADRTAAMPLTFWDSDRETSRRQGGARTCSMAAA